MFIRRSMVIGLVATCGLAVAACGGENLDGTYDGQGGVSGESMTITGNEFTASYNGQKVMSGTVNTDSKEFEIDKTLLDNDDPVPYEKDGDTLIVNGAEFKKIAD